MRLKIENKWYFLFWLYTIFIVYGTTLPFSFTISNQIIRDHTTSIISTLHNPYFLEKSYKYDIIANIIFFIPFGFFLFNSIVHRLPIKKTAWIFIKITLYGFLLSTLVETIQIFTIDRNPAISDILMNTFGTIIGVISGYLLIHFDLRKQLQETIKFLVVDPDRLILILYILFLILAGMIPYDITLNPSHILKNVTTLQSLQNLTVEYPRSLFNLIFIWGTAGYIFSRYIRKTNNTQSYFKQTAISLISGFSIVVFIEILQLFIITQNSSIADIIVGWLGVVYGTISYQYFHKELYRDNQAADSWHSYSENKNIYYFILINYIIFLSYKYAYPFNFEVSQEIIKTKLYFFIFNVTSYLPGPKVITLFKMSIKNFTLFFPAGMMLKEAELKIPKYLSGSLVKISIVIFLIFYCKLIQLFNGSQLPYFFDLIGISAGIVIGYVFWKDFKSIIIRNDKNSTSS